ncbi:hypothetical protein [Vibrio sp.]
MKYGEKQDLLPLGAKPKGGSVPKCSLLASNSQPKRAKDGLVAYWSGF